MHIINMDWITDQIAIGNFLDVDRLHYDIDAVLCLKPGCYCDDRTDVDVLCLPLIDGLGNNQKHVLDAVEYVTEIVASGDRILVHCHAGRSRSVCIVARYLMESMGMSRHDAINYIAGKREIYLSDGIDEIFEMIE